MDLDVRAPSTEPLRDLNCIWRIAQEQITERVGVPFRDADCGGDKGGQPRAERLVHAQTIGVVVRWADEGVRSGHQRRHLPGESEHPYEAAHSRGARLPM